MMTEKQNNKVLIFTAATGGGHYSSSNALKKILADEQFDVKIIDVFKISNSFLNLLICKTYKYSVYYFPQSHKFFYKLGNVIPLYNSRLHGLFVKLFCKKTVRLIDSENPGLIISVHPYGTMLLGILRRCGYFDIPIISIVTDYKFHNFYFNDKIDACIVGCEYTKETMIERGITPGKIYPFGIPVKQEFLSSGINEKIKNNDKLAVLVMSGHLGEKHMVKVVSSLLKIKQPLDLIVVCGNNQKIKNSIEKLFAGNPSDQVDLRLFGFVDNIYDLMDQADLIITKPGGLTVTEALNKRLPMVIPFCYPGQEEENRDYLVEKGMAIRVDNTEELYDIIVEFCVHRDRLMTMRQNIEDNMKLYSMKNTVNLCKAMIIKK